MEPNVSYQVAYFNKYVLEKHSEKYSILDLTSVMKKVILEMSVCRQSIYRQLDGTMHRQTHIMSHYTSK